MVSAERIHFIGIGGIGMSALVRFFLHEGRQVSGSDRASSAITDALADEGATVFSSQVAGNITPDIELVVYTEAMAHDQEEMVAARALGVPMVNYFEALGLVANDYYLIAVSGSHGKTTTTAMLIDILEAAGLDPTAVVGSLRAKTGSNFRAGKSKYAVVEACEFRRDFLHLNPDVLVITNIDYEHVDYYKDLADVQSAFRALAEKVPEDGFVVADTANPNLAPVVDGLKAKVIDYRPHISLELPLKVPGLHNRMNAAAASAVATAIGIVTVVSDTALCDFAGTWRRFEYKGTVNAAPLYDDYAHHPKEIAATVAGVRELYPTCRLVAVFQPHTYSRTAELFDDFARELSRVDRLVLLPIYAAREENTTGITSEALSEAVTMKGGHAHTFATRDSVAEYLKQEVGAHDVVVVMGAGDISQLPGLLLN
jgi:UDP-N-acetylmuramate--alanine ligase